MDKTSYWSEDGQAYYLDGWAWGVSKALRTVCMGKEEDVIKEHPAGSMKPRGMRLRRTKIKF